MVTFWQPVVVAVLIIIGFVISIFDGQGENRVNFEYTEMPIMKPIKFDTADKGFWKAIWMWLTGSSTMGACRRFLLFLDGEEYVIEKGFEFDGASVPKFLAMWLSPVGVLLMGGLVHDYGYKYAELVKTKDNESCSKNSKRNGYNFSRYLY